MRLVDGSLPYRGSRRKVRAIRLRGNWSLIVWILILFVVALVLVQVFRWLSAA